MTAGSRLAVPPPGGPSAQVEATDPTQHQLSRTPPPNWRERVAWLGCLAASISYQVTLSFAVLAAAAWLRGWPLAAGLAGAGAVIAGVPLWRRRRLDPELSLEATGQRRGVVVYSHNVLFTNPRLEEAFGAAFENQPRPDLVGLIETTKRAKAVLAEHPLYRGGFEASGWRRLEAAYARQGRGMVVLTSLEEGRIIEHGRVDLPSKQPCFYVTVATDDGPLKVIFCHPAAPHRPHLLGERNDDLEALAELVRGEELAVVLVGDFNLTAQDPAYRRLAAAGVASIDPITPTWTHRRAPVLRRLASLAIDHVFCDPNRVSFSKVEVGADRWGSDHHPLWVRVAPSREH